MARSSGGRPSPAADRSSRRWWRVRAKGCPAAILAVSKTPSPTVTEWSSAETEGLVGSTTSPLTQTRVVVLMVPSWGLGGRPEGARREHSWCHSARGEPDEAGRLELGLGPLPLGVGVPRDPGAGAEPEPPPAGVVPLGPEGADADGEVGLPGVGVDPADRPAVRPAVHRLEVTDGGQGTGLRRPGDRARRVGGREDVGPADALAQVPADGGDEVHEAGMRLDGTELVDGDGPRLADAGHVVAHEVDDHDVLGVVLGQHLLGGRRGALDGPGHETPTPTPEEELRRGADDVETRGVAANARCMWCRVASSQEVIEPIEVSVGRQLLAEH